MGTSYFPTTDAGARDWGANMATKTTATPSAYGISAPEALLFKTAFDAYDAAYTIAKEPDTRTAGTIATKDETRAAMKVAARKIVSLIRGFNAITTQQLLDLRITVPAMPTPIPPPAFEPHLDIVAVNGRTVDIRLHGPDSGKRGLPDGCSGASVFSYVGNAPPADISAWTFQGSIRKTKATVEFDSSVPAFSKVYLTAFFFNPRSQSGPACTPVALNLGSWTVSAAA